MSTEILEPGSCDKTTSGWNACGACSAGAETCTCETASGCSSGSVEKSGARFYNFDTPSQQAFWTSVIIKVDWKLFKMTDGDSASCDQNKLYLQYSLNGNSNPWTNFSGFPKTKSTSHQTGTATQSFSVGQNIANVQVRMYALAECCEPCAGADDCCIDVEGREVCYCSSCGSCPGDCYPGAC